MNVGKITVYGWLFNRTLDEKDIARAKSAASRDELRSVWSLLLDKVAGTRVEDALAALNDIECAQVDGDTEKELKGISDFRQCLGKGHDKDVHYAAVGDREIAYVVDTDQGHRILSRSLKLPTSGSKAYELEEHVKNGTLGHLTDLHNRLVECDKVDPLKQASNVVGAPPPGQPAASETTLLGRVWKNLSEHNIRMGDRHDIRLDRPDRAKEVEKLNLETTTFEAATAEKAEKFFEGATPFQLVEIAAWTSKAAIDAMIKTEPGLQGADVKSVTVTGSLTRMVDGSFELVLSCGRNPEAEQPDVQPATYTATTLISARHSACMSFSPRHKMEMKERVPGKNADTLALLTAKQLHNVPAKGLLNVDLPENTQRNLADFAVDKQQHSFDEYVLLKQHNRELAKARDARAEETHEAKMSGMKGAVRESIPVDETPMEEITRRQRDYKRVFAAELRKAAALRGRANRIDATIRDTDALANQREALRLRAEQAAQQAAQQAAEQAAQQAAKQAQEHAAEQAKRLLQPGFTDMPAAVSLATDQLAVQNPAEVRALEVQTKPTSMAGESGWEHVDLEDSALFHPFFGGVELSEPPVIDLEPARTQQKPFDPSFGNIALNLSRSQADAKQSVATPVAANGGAEQAGRGQVRDSEYFAQTLRAVPSDVEQPMIDVGRFAQATTAGSASVEHLQDTAQRPDAVEITSGQSEAERLEQLEPLVDMAASLAERKRYREDAMRAIREVWPDVGQPETDDGAIERATTVGAASVEHPQDTAQRPDAAEITRGQSNSERLARLARSFGMAASTDAGVRDRQATPRTLGVVPSSVEQPVIDDGGIERAATAGFASVEQPQDTAKRPDAVEITSGQSEPEQAAQLEGAGGMAATRGEHVLDREDTQRTIRAVPSNVEQSVIVDGPFAQATTAGAASVEHPQDTAQGGESTQPPVIAGKTRTEQPEQIDLNAQPVAPDGPEEAGAPPMEFTVGNWVRVMRNGLARSFRRS